MVKLLAILALSIGKLSAQMIAPASVDWSTVDFSACPGNFPAAGKTVKVSQIERSSDPRYVPLPDADLPIRRMGAKNPRTSKPGTADDTLNRTSKDCWPLDLWRNAFSVIEKRCIQCHGATEKVSGLDMRTRASILKGGKSGPAMVPGSTSASLLYRKMVPMTAAMASASTVDIPIQDPPSGPLAGPEIEAVRAWIANGAPTP